MLQKQSFLGIVSGQWDVTLSLEVSVPNGSFNSGKGARGSWFTKINCRWVGERSVPGILSCSFSSCSLSAFDCLMTGCSVISAAPQYGQPPPEKPTDSGPLSILTANLLHTKLKGNGRNSLNIFHGWRDHLNHLVLQAIVMEDPTM